MALGKLSAAEFWGLAVLMAASAVIFSAAIAHDDPQPIVTSIALSGIAFAAAYYLIVCAAPSFVRIGLKGTDMSKKVKKEIPECAGALCAVVYILILYLFIPFAFYRHVVLVTSGGGNRDVVQQIEPVTFGQFSHKFRNDKLPAYQSALSSLQTTIILGLGDDLLDIRWRHKIFIPAIAAIPVLAVYYTNFGSTSISVPIMFQSIVGTDLVSLGWAYYAYLGSLAIFLPNSINIFAGINGIEVMQSIVITLLLMANDSLYLFVGPYPHPATDSHLFSLFFLLPFLGVSLALFWHNKYPSSVFVGDTFCYFAGMVFVVVSILGHFGKTMLLLLIPQIVNFVYSAPQILHWIPCPRHRLPKYNVHKDVLEPSMVRWLPEAQPKRSAALFMRLLGKFGLLKVTYATDQDGKEIFVESSNMTLINLWLVRFGPMHEGKLAWQLSGMQFAVGLAALVARHMGAKLLFREDNWGLRNSAA